MELLYLTKGAANMAETDPHGWILTLVAIGVVFLALLVLFGVYSLSGALFSGKIRAKSRRASAGGEAETAAAIAAALSLYRQDAAGGEGRITIKSSPSPWADKSYGFRKPLVK